MNCPFLRETSVWSCASAALKTLIPRMAPGTAEGRCRTAGFRQCPGFHGAQAEAEATGCPLLRESLIQYCAASPMQKLVPYSESMMSRCGSGAFRYCDLYLDLAQSAQEAEEPNEPLPAPSGLRYAANHMWIDWPEEGPWHIGIDSFLARLVAPVDRILYVTPHGAARPTVALTMQDVELHVVFPAALMVSGCNLYLRSNPQRMTADPYAHGWLFEGTVGREPRERVLARLLTAAEAHHHMEADAVRLRGWVEARNGAACDGGLFEPGLLRALPREDALRLFHEYCSPAAGADEVNR